MDALFIACAAASLVLGVRRPALICALSLHSYNYECLFGSQPVVGVVLVCLLPLWALGYALVRRDGGLHLVDGLFALFTLGFLVMALRSPALDAAGEAVAKYAVTCAGMYFAPRFFFARFRDYTGFARDFAVAFVIQALMFAAIAEAPPGVERTGIGDGNAFGFGVSLNIALAVVIGYLLAGRAWLLPARPRLDRAIALIVLAAVAYATFLNGTRSALVGSFAAFVVVAAVLIWRRGRQLGPGPRLARVGGFLGLIAAAVVGAAALVAELPAETLSARMKYPLLKLANTIVLHEAFAVDDRTGSAGRTESFALAREMIARAPLLGHGLGAYADAGGGIYAVGFDGPVHGVVENMLLELAVEGGVFMPALLCAFVAAVALLGVGQLGVSPGRAASCVFLTLAIASFVMVQLGATLLIAKDLFFALGTLVGAEIVRARRLHRRRRPRRQDAALPQGGSAPPLDKRATAD